MLGNFSYFCCHRLTFSKWTFSKISFRNTISVSNGLDPDQDRDSVCPDLGLFCLSWSGSKLFTKVISRLLKSPLVRKELTLSRWETVTIFSHLSCNNGLHCHLLMYLELVAYEPRTDCSIGAYGAVFSGIILFASMIKEFWSAFEYVQQTLSGFAQTWKVLEYTVLSWKVLENKIYLEKYLKNTQRPWKVLEFYHLQEDSTLSLET